MSSCSADRVDPSTYCAVKNDCGMGDPTHEMMHSESGFRGEDVSPSTASSVLELETIKSFTELIGKGDYGVRVCHQDNMTIVFLTVFTLSAFPASSSRSLGTQAMRNPLSAVSNCDLFAFERSTRIGQRHYEEDEGEYIVCLDR